MCRYIRKVIEYRARMAPLQGADSAACPRIGAYLVDNRHSVPWTRPALLLLHALEYCLLRSAEVILRSSLENAL